MTVIQLLNGKGQLVVVKDGDRASIEAQFSDGAVRRARLTSAGLRLLARDQAVQNTHVSVYRHTERGDQRRDLISLYFNPDAYLAIVPAAAFASAIGITF
jgi:hypothetical protein